MRFIFFLTVIIFAPTALAGETKSEKEGIMAVIARMMHCNDLASKANLSLDQHSKIDAEMVKYRCATVSCDMMKIVDTYFPAGKESAETKAQMAQLGVCK